MVVTNGSHTITLRIDGKVFTYGDNTYGQLGINSKLSMDEPVEVSFPEGTIITQVAAGENHSVALDSEGNVWTWGNNEFYQVGNGSEVQLTPYKVPRIPKAIRIAAGNNNTMIITETNELYGWGQNSYGELGIADYASRVMPTKVYEMMDIIDIAGGKNHFIALNRAGDVYTTGSNLYGQLGVGNLEITKTNKFVKLNIPEKIGTIDAGELANIVTTINGGVYVWGANIYSQLGTGKTEDLSKPTRLSGISNIREVEMGRTHTLIRDGNNRVYVAGIGNFGQLGIGKNGVKTTFTANNAISNVIEVSAGLLVNSARKKHFRLFL